MIKNYVNTDELSLLGFGAMRLPTKDGAIDEELTFKMVDYAIEHGVNYFDTAWPYHGGLSEIVIGKALSRYRRESYFLANKYPGHQHFESYHPADIFEKQLEKCGVEYFDYYLLHNVYENSIQVYEDEKWGIVDYFLKQKKLGRIRHLGFSTHGSTEFIRCFLDKYGEHLEFCQIQLNYLDWTLQDGKGKYDLLTERNIPVWVMEPVRGGKLANLDDESSAKLGEICPNSSDASWGFRWLMGLENVKMILSGMSDLEQVIDNVNTFEKAERLSGEESELLMQIAEGMKNSVPCTACRYCTDGCPMQLDIPKMIGYYNDAKVFPSLNVRMSMDAIDKAHWPNMCVNCGNCRQICPQNIDIPSVLSDFDAILAKIPRWVDICRQREEAAIRATGGV